VLARPGSLPTIWEIIMRQTFIDKPGDIRVENVPDPTINPGRVFDLALPLDQVAEGYRAMDERRAIKALLWP
jgi:threonine dehydrogenase-like Zn-dependent dehydrogenase